MSAKNFKFVSPGIFIKEIDKSILEVPAGAIGPVVIGRAAKGPSGRPIAVRSYSEFVEIFGEPIPGIVEEDVFRNGNKLGPTYAAYAAKAWLRNNSPLTFIRLLGEEHTSATTSGKAGWGGGTTSGIAKLLQGNSNNYVTEGSTEGGGAYALWLFDGTLQIETQGIDGNTDANPATGSLAAIFYCNADTTIALSGAMDFDRTTPSHYTASQAATIGTSSAGTLTMLIGTPNQLHSGALGTGSALPTAVERIDFNFDRTSDSFIRKVFNTNPTLTNTTITATESKGYFLGETYEGFVEEKLVNESGTTGWNAVTHGLLMGLKSRDSEKDGADFKMTRKNAYTGWYISQDTGAPGNYNNEATQKLFRFISLDQGEWTQNNIKISIQDIKFPTDKFNKYPTFTVAVRVIDDKDANPQFLEMFTGLTLDPSSQNYIKRRVGDKYWKWNATESRYREYGEYFNRSKYLRVEMNEGIDLGAVGEGLAPFGVYGPYRFQNALNVTGTVDSGSFTAGTTPFSTLHAYHMIVGDRQVALPGSGLKHYTGDEGDAVVYMNLFSSSLNQDSSAGTKAETYFGENGSTNDRADHTSRQMSSSFYFPELGLRQNAKEEDIEDARVAYWGVRTRRSGSNIFDDSVRDVIRALPGGIDACRDGGDNYTNHSWIFSLDDINEETTTGDLATYESGSRANSKSYTANNSAKKLVNEKKWNKFTTLLHGGFDGFDVTEKEPLRNSLLDNGATEKDNYAYNTVKQAIQSIRDPELLEYNIAAVPGITQKDLTKLLVDQCADRADALAIIDLENSSDSMGSYVPNTEGTTSEKDRVDNQSIDTLRTKLENREINSSYGCTYYPWVQIRDRRTNMMLKVPPSVVAMGAMSFSDAQQAPWFAPAGFTRGGLSNGAAGLSVVGITHKLTSDDRDKLYEANINPIATFPAEGIVVFGQKTLQVTPSALDRINVRRLLIFLKKEVSRIAATTLFEQNVQSTWLSFSSRVKRFLSGVKSQLGLTDYKVILDETTTTPDMIDRNIMYAKIFLKPARSIEFIALDFIITDSGASFED